jgi:hypothetical protein
VDVRVRRQPLQHVRVEVDAADDDGAVVDEHRQRGVVGHLDEEVHDGGGVLRPVEDGGHEDEDVVGAAVAGREGLVDDVACAAGPAALRDDEVRPAVGVCDLAGQLDELAALCGREGAVLPAGAADDDCGEGVRGCGLIGQRETYCRAART